MHAIVCLMGRASVAGNVEPSPLLAGGIRVTEDNGDQADYGPGAVFSVRETPPLPVAPKPRPKPTTYAVKLRSTATIASLRLAAARLEDRSPAALGFLAELARGAGEAVDDDVQITEDAVMVEVLRNHAADVVDVTTRTTDASDDIPF